MEEVNQNIQKTKKINIFSSKNIHEITPEKDIKYRGPLSYRHLRILGWLFLAISQVGVMMGFAVTLNNAPTMFGNAPQILQFFLNFMSPLFIVAAFSRVLNQKNGYKKQIIIYGGGAILIVLAFLLIFLHYIVGIYKTLDPTSTIGMAQQFLQVLASSKGFLAFNIMLDLLLSTLVEFFINYTPKKFFQGKQIYIFRSFVALPIIYEITSIVIKILCTNSVVSISPFVFPFLTTKPPLTFFVFLIMSLFFKRRERRFYKMGKTKEDYEKFKNTNLNSVQFSIYLSIVIAIAAAFDFLIVFTISLVLSSQPMPVEFVDKADFVFANINSVYSWGFGQTVPLLLIVPIIILFDYTKTYKDNKLDIFIPAAGIALTLIIYLEGGFQVITNYFKDMGSKDNTESFQIEAIKQAIHKILRK